MNKNVPWQRHVGREPVDVEHHDLGVELHTIEGVNRKRNDRRDRRCFISKPVIPPGRARNIVPEAGRNNHHKWDSVAIPVENYSCEYLRVHHLHTIHNWRVREWRIANDNAGLVVVHSKDFRITEVELPEVMDHMPCRWLFDVNTVRVPTSACPRGQESTIPAGGIKNDGLGVPMERGYRMVDPG